jgi:hypothetical protein
MSEDKQIAVPSGIFKPLSLRGIPPWAVYFFSLIGFVYILNPTLGIFELLPDNLPVIGNLDESAATMLIWFGIVEFFEGRKYRRASKGRS